MKGLIVAVALLCLACTNVFAQTTNARVSGTVSDATGALIPGVAVTATNAETGIVTTVLTNEAGAYNLASLQPGLYKLSAELSGFQVQTYTDLRLGTAEQIRLNFSLKVASVAQSVEVAIPVDTLIATSSSSVGTVLPENTVRDLPIIGRDALDLVTVMAGFREATDPMNSNARTGANGEFVAGISASAVNTTRDGITVNDGRYALGVFSATRINPDLVGEMRIILAPVDAETGRGSGQVQIITRSGTNKYAGGAVWNVQNTALNANTWNNNRTNTSPGWQNRQQLSVNYGGPIVKNKTFFFALFDGQRVWARESVRALVLTSDARNGNFRYFPGVVNGNADAAVVGGANPTAPVVDRLGNPVRPAAATGDLRTINVFTVDPLRPGFDKSGYIQRVIAGMPQPNDFTGGDGLNTAMFKWNRREDSLICAAICQQGLEDDVYRNQFNVKIDHNFSAKHKFNIGYTNERLKNTGGLPNYPGKELEWVTKTTRKPQVLTASFVSTLSSNIVNEARFGIRRADSYSPRPVDAADTKDDILKYLPVINGYPVIFTSLPINIANNQLAPGNNTNGNKTTLWTYADSISWTKGKHAFKGGGEFRIQRAWGVNSLNGIPSLVGGAGLFSVPAITGAAANLGLLANNETTLQNLLLTLNGSVGTIAQQFIINDPKWTDFRGYTEDNGYYKIRKINQNEFDFFIKDDYKVLPSLTLNLGVRYDFYGVPWEGSGMTGALLGGGLAGLGWSGRSFADFWNFGPQKGDLTTVEFVGPNSPNPGKQIYKSDLNNFAPALGFSWKLPWFGENKTTVRGGYGISYQGGGRGLELDTALTTNLPGINDSKTVTQATFSDLSTLVLPLPRNKPLQPVPLTDRAQSLTTWDPNYVTPYIQNITLSVTREVRRNVAVDLRYIGTRGVKLYGNIALNQANFLTNGLLDALNTTRNGGTAPLFDQMFKGVVLNTGQPAVGTGGVTGSAALRASTIYRGNIANGNYAAVAATLNTSNITGVSGGLLRNAGLPENFIVNNPQFNGVQYNTNDGSSTYHSLQTQVTYRPTAGLTYQATYVWSRGISNALSGWSNPVDRSLDRTLQASHRTHDFRTNGSFELPIGPNKMLLGGSSGVLARVVERWQLSWIANLISGQPLSITGTNTYINNGRLDIVGAFPKKGEATMTPGGLPQYFSEAGFKFIRDPGCAAATLAQCTNNALTDSAGNILLQHAAPGREGTLGDMWLEGPGSFRFDLSASKTMRLTESKSLQVRVDARNVLNHPIMGNPSLNINNAATFGQISGANVTGARQFQGQLRLSF